ncbi:hypothetical protein [uncultured Olleya sp.]|uniref:hypothetical protein n=1 Tax=uncultured Olleya sp. TaxID=757243 RepID=UPI002598260D|nr:hypothetical protein [uncultured Olleya sp.]
MENGIILLMTILICFGIISFFLFWLNKRKKKHLLTIESDWIKFNKSIKNNHIEGVSKFGTELIYNEHFTMVRLKEMSKLINTLEEQNIELKKSNRLEELKSLIYNKYLDWNLEYPYAGNHL